MNKYILGNTHGPCLCAHTCFYAVEWNSPYSERHSLIYELPHLVVKHVWPKQSPLRYSGGTAAMLIMAGWRGREGDVYHAEVFVFIFTICYLVFIPWLELICVNFCLWRVECKLFLFTFSLNQETLFESQFFIVESFKSCIEKNKAVHFYNIISN